MGSTLITTTSFRESFKLPRHFKPNIFTKAFPIHMAKGMNSMRSKAAKCDCLIEIRDARVPISSFNAQFEQFAQRQNRLLLVNKIDLADERRTKQLLRKYISNTPNTKVLFTNNKAGTGGSAKSIKTVMSILHKMSSEKNEALHVARKQKEHDEEYDVEDYDYDKLDAEDEVHEYTLRTLVYGLPNSGKSSFINSARQKYTIRGRGKKATPVGKNPGVTKFVLRNIAISDSPKILMLDTPGIVPPSLDDPLVGLNLALTGIFPDDKIGHEVMADYLLYTLNKQNNRSYLEMCGLEKPCDDFDQVVASHSAKHGFTIRGGPDYRHSSIQLIVAFRKGVFGRITLD